MAATSIAIGPMLSKEHLVQLPIEEEILKDYRKLYLVPILPLLERLIQSQEVLCACNGTSHQ